MPSLLYTVSTCELINYSSELNSLFFVFLFSLLFSSIDLKNENGCETESKFQRVCVHPRSLRINTANFRAFMPGRWLHFCCKCSGVGNSHGNFRRCSVSRTRHGVACWKSSMSCELISRRHDKVAESAPSQACVTRTERISVPPQKFGRIQDIEKLLKI